MSDINHVFIEGRLTADPKRKGKNARFQLAHNRNWKDKDGEWQQEPCFVLVYVWNISDGLADKLAKGVSVRVNGRLSMIKTKNEDQIVTISAFDVKPYDPIKTSSPATNETEDDDDDWE